MFRFYIFTPKKYREWVEDYIAYSNFHMKPESFINFVLLAGLIIPTFIVGMFWYLGFLPTLLAVLVWLITLSIFEIIAHFILILSADARANFTEEILPDSLQLISANIRSGLTVDKAILTSARPEFGPLEHELRKVAKETLSGRALGDSLKNISKKIKSGLLDRTINLLVEGINKGGNIADLLDNISEDVRQAKTLRREIKAYVMMYSIFIFFAVCIGAPLLFSVSTFLVQTMTKFTVTGEELFTTTQLPLIKFTGTPVSTKFLTNYSILAIVVSSIFGSLLIGLIQEGTEKAGLKYIPIVVLVSLGVLFLSKILLAKIFTGIVT
ncbi:type II secretion system F family protein [archaeon]|nr:type II secretion system F family protein [archaeon]